MIDKDLDIKDIMFFTRSNSSRFHIDSKFKVGRTKYNKELYKKEQQQGRL